MNNYIIRIPIADIINQKEVTLKSINELGIEIEIKEKTVLQITNRSEYGNSYFMSVVEVYELMIEKLKKLKIS